MVEIPVRGVIGGDRVDEHLWRHGLQSADAEEVWLGPAKYFTQPARQHEDELGNIRNQPQRLLMIGPDHGGRLLTIVLELSDGNGYSRVVTGWHSSDSERTRYHQPGGRTRRR